MGRLRLLRVLILLAAVPVAFAVVFYLTRGEPGPAAPPKPAGPSAFSRA